VQIKAIIPAMGLFFIREVKIKLTNKNKTA